MDLSRPRSYLTAKAEVRESAMGGQGVFAREPISSGELVAIWGGGVMTYAELMALPDAVNGYAIQVWDDLFVGPRSLAEVEPSDFINHSCKPNCGLKGSVVVVARRDIAAGEELTYDYGTTDALGPDMECMCLAPGCRGRVTAEDWRDPVFRASNAAYLSAWIRELIAREGPAHELVEP